MAQRRVSVSEIGEVILAKRRGSTNMRLSVNAKGQVRVGMPYWTPYEAGLLFIRQRRAWIKEQLAIHAPPMIEDGDRIGKAHRFIFNAASPAKSLIYTKITATTVELRTSLALTDYRVQAKAKKACEEALKMEARHLLPIRVSDISRKYTLPYQNLRIRKLTSRWGSCSSQKNISLSYFLIQLPWELIDYVILHELAHTKFLNHSSAFWNFMQQRTPNLKETRRQIKSHKPRIEPSRTT